MINISLDDTFLDDMELHKDYFITALAHDHRGGRRVLHFGKGRYIRRCSAKKAEALCEFADRDRSERTSFEDSYITLNTFTRGSNKTFNLYNRAGIYIDIDGHDLSAEKLYTEKERFLLCFNKAVNDGFLPAPTFVNDTGRGLAVFYILDRSISAKNTGSCGFLDALQGSITARITDIVNLGGIGLSVDTSVGDVSRIVRLPGTYNTEAKAWCRIIFANMDEEDEKSLHYATTNELKLEGDLFVAKSRRNYRTKMQYQQTGKTRNLLRYLDLSVRDTTRLFRERAAQEVTGFRELYLFLIYNQAVQYMKKEDAREYIRKLNDELSRPLNDKEIEHLMHSVDSCEETHSKTKKIRGYYIISKERLISKLGLSPEECEKRELFVPYWRAKRRAKRRALKQEHQNAREKRNAEIVKMAADHTYAEVAETFGLSLSYVKTLLRKQNFRKTQPKPKEAVLDTVDVAEEVLDTADIMDEVLDAAADTKGVSMDKDIAKWIIELEKEFGFAPSYEIDGDVIKDLISGATFKQAETPAPVFVDGTSNEGHIVESFRVPSAVNQKSKKTKRNAKFQKMVEEFKTLVEKAHALGYLPDEHFLRLHPVHITALYLNRKMLANVKDINILSYAVWVDRLIELVEGYKMGENECVYLPNYHLGIPMLDAFCENPSWIGDLCKKLKAMQPEKTWNEKLSPEMVKALSEYEDHLEGFDQDLTIPVEFLSFEQIDKEYDGKPKLHARIDALD